MPRDPMTLERDRYNRLRRPQNWGDLVATKTAVRREAEEQSRALAARIGALADRLEALLPDAGAAESVITVKGLPTSRAEKTLPALFELKAFDGAEGSFEAMAAVFDQKDEAGDVVERGAFAKTLRDRAGKIPIFFQHKIDEPIGFSDVAETDAGLYVRGKLNLDVRRARETHALMRQAKAEDVPFGLSFGFDTKQSYWKGSTRHVTEVRLWEISPTLFPAQPLALVTGVKSAAADSERAAVEELLRDMRATAARYLG